MLTGPSLFDWRPFFHTLASFLRPSRYLAFLLIDGDGVDVDVPYLLFLLFFCLLFLLFLLFLTRVKNNKNNKNNKQKNNKNNEGQTFPVL